MGSACSDVLCKYNNYLRLNRQGSFMNIHQINGSSLGNSSDWSVLKYSYNTSATRIIRNKYAPRPLKPKGEIPSLGAIAEWMPIEARTIHHEHK